MRCIALLTLAACTGGPAATPPAEPATAPEEPVAAEPAAEVPTEEPVAEPPSEPVGPHGIVTAVQNGDASCYFILRPIDGTNEQSYSADFDLCDEAWVGKNVTLRMEQAQVMADSCEGDPTCTDRMEVAMAVEVIDNTSP